MLVNSRLIVIMHRACITIDKTKTSLFRLRRHVSFSMHSFNTTYESKGTESKSRKTCGIASMNTRFKVPVNKNYLSTETSGTSIDNEVVETDMGSELTGFPKDLWSKTKLIHILNDFFTNHSVKSLALSDGIDDKLYNECYLHFKNWVVETNPLPVDLHIVLSDILQDSGHISDIYPYFRMYTKFLHPELENLKEISKTSDLRDPKLWYPETRKLKRKIVFHTGPTNSGKTFHALKRFREAKSGIYCGPLRLLASEVFINTNREGLDCDLITGEELRFSSEDGSPASHLACTVEMAGVETKYDVGVIDEIQMIRDLTRGWAWTRVLLGLAASEVHVCGEESCVEFVRDLVADIGDDFEVHKYDRLTPLKIRKSLGDLSKVKKGDCVVCFSKSDIHTVNRVLNRFNISTAVIYGSLPAVTKLAAAEEFNSRKKDVLVATDAVGMGLNLYISRVVFYSLERYMKAEESEQNSEPSKTGEAEPSFNSMAEIPAHLAIQIAGRAGRYGMGLKKGDVTTLHKKHEPLLEKLLATKIPPIEKAGLSPTAEQIELMSYYLPNSTLAQILTKFEEFAQMDNSKYFLCNMAAQKEIAALIEPVALALQAKYIYCRAPVTTTKQFVMAQFYKMARSHGDGIPVTHNWLVRELGLPVKPAKNLAELEHLESVFEITELYLWLSNRFPEIMVDAARVREMQTVIDQAIRTGIQNLAAILPAADQSDRTPEPVATKKLIYNTYQCDSKLNKPDLQDIKHIKDEINSVNPQHRYVYIDSLKWTRKDGIKAFLTRFPQHFDVQHEVVFLRSPHEGGLPEEDAWRVLVAVNKLYENESVLKANRGNNSIQFKFQQARLSLVYDKLIRLQSEKGYENATPTGTTEEDIDSDTDSDSIIVFPSTGKRSVNTREENDSSPNTQDQSLRGDVLFIDYDKIGTPQKGENRPETNSSLVKGTGSETNFSSGENKRNEYEKKVENSNCKEKESETESTGHFSMMYIKALHSVEKPSHPPASMDGSSLHREEKKEEKPQNETITSVQTDTNNKSTEKQPIVDTPKLKIPKDKSSRSKRKGNTPLSVKTAIKTGSRQDQHEGNPFVPIRDLEEFHFNVCIFANQNTPYRYNFRNFIYIYKEYFELQGDYVRRRLPMPQNNQLLNISSMKKHSMKKKTRTH